MPYRRICIIGLGLLGGSLGMAARRRRLVGEVVGVARRPETLSLARERGAIDVGSLDAREVLPSCDLVVLCVPVLSITSLLAEIAPYVAPGAVVTDVGSTKEEISAAGELLLPGRFLGGHPMAGSEQAGIESADDMLFEGAVWAFTPGPHAAPVEPLLRLARGVGALPLVLAPEQHDRAVAVTSHVPHVLASALARAAADTLDGNEAVPLLAAGSFRDATRVAVSPPGLWRDVCLTNRAAILEALDAFESGVDELRRALQSGDAEAIERFFARGRDSKRRVEHARGR